MKKTIRYQIEGKTVEEEVNYIPIRFILAIILAVRLIPIAGFMAYFLFYGRKLKKKFICLDTVGYKEWRSMDDAAYPTCVFNWLKMM